MQETTRYEVRPGNYTFPTFQAAVGKQEEEYKQGKGAVVVKIIEQVLVTRRL
jgi:hypothetical protein